MTRLDRTGEPLDEDVEEIAEKDHDQVCVDGWLPDDHMGRPRPCLTCRPWLADRRHRLRRLVEGPRTP